MAVRLQLQALARVLGVAFWTLVGCFGVYFILNLQQRNFWRSVHELSEGLLLLLLALHNAFGEIRDVLPMLSAAPSRWRQLGHACMYLVVGGFLSDPFGHDDTGGKVMNIIGPVVCLVSWVMALLRLVLVFLPQVPAAAAANGGADSGCDLEEQSESRRSVARASVRASTVNREGSVKEPRPSEGLLTSTWPPASEPAEDDMPRSRSNASSADTHRGSSIFPEIARWQPEQSTTESQNGRTASSPRNPFADG